MAKIKVTVEDFMGDDLIVVDAARVSFGARSDWGEVIHDAIVPGAVKLKPKDQRLIRYLARGVTQGDYDLMIDSLHNTLDRDYIAETLEHYRGVPIHRSPFNHVFASFTVTAPVYVARQLVKHEYLVWNEISGRYVTFDPTMFIPTYRAKAADKKQGSGEEIEGSLQGVLQAATEKAHRDAYNAYQDLLQAGVAEEQARGILPLNLMTQWRWSGSLGAFAKMAGARLKPDAQAETREVAEQIDEHMWYRFPVAWSALVHPMRENPYGR